ncbi:MAG TPA: nucleoside triphosphate pyrophosphohydrolase [Gammaproteobacteria bacterium]|nr:nucleoside triphosphate pyrophosphohydrolase [Gammaproteobacteria bacterium]
MNESEFTAKTAIENLLTLMTMLRDKDFGCPWDLQQTIASLVPYTLEEVYEVVDAIEKQDMLELEDELGDLLFQVVFYTQIAAEEGLFDFDDVANAITRKLIRRHPHVFPKGKQTNFGNKADISSDQVVVNWEAIKQQERQEKQRTRQTNQSHSGDSESSEASNSILDDVPRALPALERARKLQKRAARVGFDWPEIEPVIAKLKEEVAELESALREGDQQQISNELGDVLFAAVNLARHASVEPELALRSANQRFEDRFKWIESTLSSRGKTLSETNLEELDLLWDKAKQKGL